MFKGINMIGYFKIKECKLHPAYLNYGTLGTKDLKEGLTYYHNGKYYTFKDVLKNYIEDIDKCHELIRQKIKGPQLQSELDCFDRVINNSDIKFTLQYGTLTNFANVIKDLKPNQLLSTSGILDTLMRGAKLATYIAFACACIIATISDYKISDNEKQIRINSIVEDLDNVATKLSGQ